jgi:hypothetical protein
MGTLESPAHVVAETFELPPQGRPDGLSVVPRGAARPVFFVGDESVMRFGNAIIDEPAVLGETFVTRAVVCRGLHASQLVSNGALHPLLAHAMLVEDLVVQTPQGWHAEHLLRAPAPVERTHGRSNARIAPYVILAFGALDVRDSLVRPLTEPLADFPLPDGVALDPAEYPPLLALRQVALGDVVQAASQLAAPLISAAKSLRGLGLRNLYLQTLPPERPDEGAAAPVTLRQKCAIVFNDALRRLAKEHELKLLDPWSARRDGTGADPAYCLSALVDEIYAKSTPATNEFWQCALALSQADSAPRAPALDAGIQARFAAEPAVTIALGSTAAERFRDRLPYAHSIGNAVLRLDWSGNSLRPFCDYIRSVFPDQAYLRDLYELLYSAELERFIWSCMGTDYTFPVIRPFKTLLSARPPDPGPQTFHFDGCPPGVLRGLLYLTDVTAQTGAFEYLDRAGNPTPVCGPAGTLVVFDANGVRHRGRPAETGERQVIDLVIAPRVPGEPRYVMWSGTNAWPVDPFSFTLRGCVAYPPFPE